MKPRISLITLGVDDLEESLRFYRDGLGLETQGIIGTEFEYGAVAFFDLQANLKLALYPRKGLSKDSGLPLGAPSALDSVLVTMFLQKLKSIRLWRRQKMLGLSS
ncbi:MAG: VOC family protein [Acidithiobacillus sp.]